VIEKFDGFRISVVFLKRSTQKWSAMKAPVSVFSVTLSLPAPLQWKVVQVLVEEEVDGVLGKFERECAQ
jgi:hypothetical protein